ncbi:cation-transporting P-type ATPase [Flavobacterium ginsengisoli]|uniref:cation-transporting P-type ATPase n=1 Tax=Flavobacterium ginsengisoli TaxID=871694 RepID=UPI0030F7A0B2
MEANEQELIGLNFSEVDESRKEFGTNQYHYKKENRILAFFKNVFAEPMILLLLAASEFTLLIDNIAMDFFF